MTDNPLVSDWWKSLAIFTLGCLVSGVVFFVRDIPTTAQINFERNEQRQRDATQDSDIRLMRDNITAIKATLDTLTNVIKAGPVTR